MYFKDFQMKFKHSAVSPPLQISKFKIQLAICVFLRIQLFGIEIGMLLIHSSVFKS